MSEGALNTFPVDSVATEDQDEGAHVRFLWLPVTEVRPYARNPRRTDNPEYHRIAASIRAEGMDQPLVVTKRPGDAHYTVQAGGNTRLRIVQALFAETGDPRFAQAHCLFRPWRRESDVLLAHLKENDLHGPLTFIDKALAVADAKRLLEAELQEDDLSQRRLAALLKARGYGLSHGLISQMGFAVDTLLPAMPQALYAGLGRPQVERLRALDKAAGTLWQHYGLGEETAYRETFSQLCRRHDGPDWDIAPLRAALESELAENAAVGVQAMRAQLTACLAGQPIEIAEMAGSPKAAIPVHHGPEATESAPIPDAEIRQDKVGAAAFPQSTEIERDEQGGDGVQDWKDSSEGDRLDAAGETDEDAVAKVTKETAHESSQETSPSPDKADPPDEPTEHSENSLPSDLKSLRARAWTLATRLAQRHGIGELIEPLPSQGLGFVLRDVPDPALSDQLDAETLSRLSLLW
jgi:ParB family protein of integrating conjugative element (PFGI_1 class)